MSRTLYPTQAAGPTDWSVSAWSLTGSAPFDESPPVAGDTVIFTAGSGEITMTGDSADGLADVTIGGGVLDMAGFDILLNATGGFVASGGTISNGGGVRIGSGGFDIAAGVVATGELDVTTPEAVTTTTAELATQHLGLLTLDGDVTMSATFSCKQ